MGTIQTFRCPKNQWCGIKEGQYAWVKASKNSLTDSAKRLDSALFKKITSKSCEDIGVFS